LWFSIFLGLFFSPFFLSIFNIIYLWYKLYIYSFTSKKVKNYAFVSQVSF
jgi:hypothetical protein